jgi:hypothetical protein
MRSDLRGVTTPRGNQVGRELRAHVALKRISPARNHLRAETQVKGLLDHTSLQQCLPQ